MKSSDAKASKSHLKFSSKMTVFIKLVYLSSVISLKWQLIGNLHFHLSEITELKYTSLIKMIILEENFKWHLEAFASELFIYFIFVLFCGTNMTKFYLHEQCKKCIFHVICCISVPHPQQLCFDLPNFSGHHIVSKANHK